MSSTEFHPHTREEFLGEFFPDAEDKAAIAAGMEQLRAEQRAWRLAEVRRRLGVTRADHAGTCRGIELPCLAASRVTRR